MSWDRARLSYLGTVSAANVDVAWRPARAGREVRIRVPRLEVALGVPPLGSWIRSVDARGPEVGIRWQPGDGSDGDGRARRFPALSLGSVTIEGGRLVLAHGVVEPISVASDGVRVEGRASGSGLWIDLQARSLDLGLHGGRDVKLMELQASGLLEPRGITVAAAQAQGARSTLTGRGFIGPDLQAWRLAGELDLADLPVAPAQGAGRDAWERTSIRGIVDALVVSSRTTTVLWVDLARGHGTVAGVPVGATDAEAVVTPAGLVLSPVDVETAPGSALTGALALAWRGGVRYAGHLRGAVAIASVATALERELPAAAQVAVDGTFGGGGGAFEASAVVATDLLQVNGVALGRAAGTLTYDGDALQIACRLADGARGGARLTVAPGQVAIDLEGVALPAADAARLATLGTLPWQATVTARGRVAWHDGRLGSDPLVLAFVPGAGPRPIAGTLRLAGREPREVDVTLGGAVAIRAVGSGGRLQATAEAPSLHALAAALSEASGMFGEPVTLPPELAAGPITITGVVELPPERALRIDAAIETCDVAAGPVACETAAARLSVAGNRVRLDRIAASCGGGSLTGSADLAGDVALDVAAIPLGGDVKVSGSIRRDGSGVRAEMTALEGRLEARARGSFDLARGEGELRATGVDPPGAGAGLATLSARVPFRWEGRELSADGSLAVQPAADLGLPGLVGRVRAGGGRVTLTARDQTERLKVEAALRLETGLPFRVGAEGTSLQASPRFLDWLLRSVRAPAWLRAPAEEPWHGTVSGSVAAAGSTRGLSFLEASLSGMTLARGSTMVLSSGSLGLRRDQEGFTITHARAEGPWIALEGDWPGGGEPQVTGTVDLRGVELLMPEVRGSGLLRIATAGAGSAIAFDDVAFAHRELPLGLSALHGRVAWREGRIVVERLRGEVGDGTLQASGAAGAPGDELRIALTPATLPRLVSVPGLHGALAADLRVRTGASEVPRVEGTVTLSRGAYRRDVDVVALARRRAGGIALSGEPPCLLDVRVVTEGPIAIRNNLVTASLEGELRLRGDARQPRVAAALAFLPGGRAVLAGQRYDVASAGLSGRDLLRGDWRAEALASTHVAGYAVTVALSAAGQERGGAIDVELTSSPALPREDVQALVLLGARAKDLPPGALPALSASLLLSPVVQGIEGGFRRVLGVDRVRIEPHLTASEHAATARVTVEKRVTEELSLVVSSSAGDRREDLVAVEYSGLPGDRRVLVSREGDASLAVELSREVAFGTP